MTNYLNWKKENNESDDFFHDLFTLEIPRKENVATPRAHYSLKNLVLHSEEKADYDNFIMSFPDIAANSLLTYFRESPVKREIQKNGNNIHFSDQFYYVRDEREISNSLEVAFTARYIRPLSLRYIYQDLSDNKNLTFGDITRDFVRNLSLFITLNEIIAFKSNGIFSFRVEAGKIEEAYDYELLGDFLKKNNPDGTPNAIMSELAHQYHTLQFPSYPHTEKLAKLLIKNGKNGELTSLFRYTQNKNPQELNPSDKFKMENLDTIINLF